MERRTARWGAERNECLAERLRNDFRFELPELAEPDDQSDSIEGLNKFISELRQRVRTFTDRRWEVLEN
jgi:hypothetical protein